MIEHVQDKVRIFELEPLAPAWVHTIEISNENCGANFVTVWTCSPTHMGHPGMQSFVDQGLVSTEHDPAIYHADDQVYKWIEIRYPGKPKGYWRLHYHWPISRVPTLEDVEMVLGHLGDAVSEQLRSEIKESLGGK